MTLSCTDSCTMCNNDGTVCAVTKEFGFTFMPWASQFAEFEYVVGRNDTVRFGTFGFSVNGEECESTRIKTCQDGYFGYFVDCENLGHGTVDPCGEDLGNDGPLALISWQESALRQGGCRPRLHGGD